MRQYRSFDTPGSDPESCCPLALDMQIKNDCIWTQSPPSALCRDFRFAIRTDAFASARAVSTIRRWLIQFALFGLEEHFAKYVSNWIGLFTTNVLLILSQHAVGRLLTPFRTLQISFEIKMLVIII